MPILYVTNFLTLLLFYWLDKCLCNNFIFNFIVLKYYKSPPQSKIFLSNFFLLGVLFGTIIHLCFGIWIYGSPSILTDVSQSSSDILKYFNINNDSNGFGYTIIERIFAPHNLLLVGLLFLIVIFLFIKYTIWEFLIGCICGKCSNNIINRIENEMLIECKNYI